MQPHQRFHVAPMQAYTNRHMRRLCWLLSKRAVLWTEMEKASDLLASAAAAERRLRHPAAERCVLQLGGSDIPSLQDACRLANAYGFDEVNLNCGCPSVETGGADYGAALMLDPARTAEILGAMADVSVRDADSGDLLVLPRVCIVKTGHYHNETPRAETLARSENRARGLNSCAADRRGPAGKNKLHRSKLEDERTAAVRR